MNILRALYQLLIGVWSYGCLVVLLTIAASLPLIQFATLGYMVECAGRVSHNRPWKECFPGASIARRLIPALGIIGLSWLPVWYAADLAYSSELINPGSEQGGWLRALARLISIIWILWIGWAVFRGARVRDFVWPAPVLFLTTIWRPSTWKQAEERFWSLIAALKPIPLFWSGVQVSFGAVTLLMLPGGLMILGLSANGPGAGLAGLLGAIGMAWILTLLPSLQANYAETKRFSALFQIGEARKSFQFVPWSTLVAVICLYLAATPLYLLRIEIVPAELHWILTFFFVFFMFPSRLTVAWAWRRYRSATKRTFWLWRYIAWILLLSVVAAYISVLYIARFTSWEGAAIFLLQHAFLPPVPFFVK